MIPETVLFERGDFFENYRRLLVFAYILPDTNATLEELREVEEEVADLVPSYRITANGELHVDAGSPEYDHPSALLLRYLADHRQQDCFTLSLAEKEIVRVYFSEEVIHTAFSEDAPQQATRLCSAHSRASWSGHRHEIKAPGYGRVLSSSVDSMSLLQCPYMERIIALRKKNT